MNATMAPNAIMVNDFVYAFNCSGLSETSGRYEYVSVVKSQPQIAAKYLHKQQDIVSVKHIMETLETQITVELVDHRQTQSALVSET